MEYPFDYPASVVESDTAVIFCLNPDLEITYCNPAWDQFALENGGAALCRPGPIGRCVLDYISGPDRAYFADAYARALSSTTPWEHPYECSSPGRYRKFQMRAVPMRKTPGLLVINSLQVERPQTWESSAPLERVFRNEDGIIAMCGHCRRTRRNRGGSEFWDWVPDFVERQPQNVSHTICSACLEHYYPIVE